VYRVLLIVIVIIVYGSLYPWEFHSIQLAASPLWVLAHSWPTVINRFVLLDIAINLLLYIPIGVFGFLAFRQNLRGGFAVMVSLLAGIVLSSSIEMIQLFDDARDCSAFDVVCNVTGTAIGVGLASLYQRWLKQIVARAESARFFHPTGALLLAYTWLAYEVFPLFPSFSRTRLAGKLHVLFTNGSISPLDTFTNCVEWLVLAELLASVWGPVKLRRWLPLLMLVLPAKLLIAGRSLTWSELLGAVLAWISWFLLSSNRRRAAPIAVLLIMVLILRGLAPYHWSSIANSFSWIPFSGFLEANREFSMLIFLRKCFWYGSAIWLLRASGWRLATGAVSVALLLATIEVAQIYLPGRVAEITDPVLVLILAATLGLLERNTTNTETLSAGEL